MRSGLGPGLVVAIRPSTATVLLSFRYWAALSAAAARASVAACRCAVLILVVACRWVWAGPAVRARAGGWARRWNAGVGVRVEESGEWRGLSGGVEEEADQEGLCGNLLW